MKKMTKKEMATEIMALTYNFPINEVNEKSIEFKKILKKTHETLCRELMIIRRNEDQILKNTEAFNKAKNEKLALKNEEVSEDIKNALEDLNLSNEEIEAKNKPKTGEKKMKENFVIGTRDCSQWKYGKKIKKADATEAVEAVEAVKAVEAVDAIEAVKTDKKAKIKAVKAVPAIEAVEAIEAVKAVPAKPATNGSIQMYFKALTEEIAHEAVARMVAEGLTPDNADEEGNAVFFDEDHKIWFFSFTHEQDRKLRDVFKTIKSKDGYNAPGLAILKAEEKAVKKAEALETKKAEAEAKAKKEEKEEPKGNIKTGKKAEEIEKTEAGAAKVEASEVEDCSDDEEWPS